MIVNEGTTDDFCFSSENIFFFWINSSRTPIKCDNIVRLYHVTTHRNLHSHHYPSPLSNNQEVSAYGEEGVGDEGDRWKVVCTTKNDYWLRKDPVRFQHVTTGK